MTLLGKDTSAFWRLTHGVGALIHPKRIPKDVVRPAARIAHRGVAGDQPENTVAACQVAIERGAAGVELDVCVSRDGTCVLWHDRDPNAFVALARQNHAERQAFVPCGPDFDRSTRRAVSELSWEELRQGYGYLRPDKLPKDWVDAPLSFDAPIERLDAALGWASTEPHLQCLMLDIKLAPEELALVPALCETLKTALAQHPGLAERTLKLLCPQREVFTALSQRCASGGPLATFQLTADFELPGILETARELGARHVSVGASLRRLWPSVRNDVIQLVAARERRELDSLTVWTIDDAERLAELDRIGVDAVIVTRALFDGE